MIVFKQVGEDFIFVRGGFRLAKLVKIIIIVEVENLSKVFKVGFIDFDVNTFQIGGESGLSFYLKHLIFGEIFGEVLIVFFRNAEFLQFFFGLVFEQFQKAGKVIIFSAFGSGSFFYGLLIGGSISFAVFDGGGETIENENDEHGNQDRKDDAKWAKFFGFLGIEGLLH